MDKIADILPKETGILGIQPTQGNMSREDKSVLYVNIRIHDASAVIKAKVTKKVEGSNLPKPIKSTIAKKVATVASQKVSPSDVAKKLSVKLCRKLPEKMKEKGLSVNMEESFREGPYIVLGLQVQQVDMLAVEKAQREDNADLSQEDDASTNCFAGILLEWFFKLIGKDNKRKLEEDFLPEKVQEKLETEMMTMMAEKFEKKQLKADVEVLREEKQARFFYSTLKEMKAEVEAQNGTNPIKELKAKISGSGEMEDSDSDDSL